MTLRDQHVAAKGDKSLAKRISEMATETAERSGEGDAGQMDLIDYKPRKPQSKPAQRPAPRPHRPPGQSGRAQRERASAIRAWAAKHGYEVSPMGRINKEVVTAYEAAQARGRSRADRKNTTKPLAADPAPDSRSTRGNKPGKPS